MKIVVYTIAKDEAQFVWRWWDSAKDADEIVLVDTGSTDETVIAAETLGITVHQISVSPWRFDDARNAALALLPADADVCVSVDVDEVLRPGWREALEAQWGQANHGRYLYTWNHDEDGNPGVTYWYEKIHARHGFRWKNPVHEILQPDRIEERWVNVEGMEVHHYPDPSKSRGQYLDLLELAVREEPTNDRNAYYYARELMFYGRNAEAVEAYKRHLALPTATWPAERAASYRGLAKVDDPENRERWLIMACDESNEREPMLELAQFYHDRGDWEKCFIVCQRMLSITDQQHSYLTEKEAWGARPHDLMALSAYHLGRLTVAVEQGLCALTLEPDNERLIENLAWYRGERA